MKIKSITHVTLSEPKQYYDVIEAAPYNNFLIKTASGYIVSHNCNFTDECNFGLVANPEKQKKRMLKLVTQIDARMKSRFMRGTYLPTLNILASSKDTEQSFLEDYISTTVANNQTNTLIVDEPQWVVDARKDSPEKFWVGIGNKFLANELLPLDVTKEQLDEYRDKGYELWQVPMGYIDTFQKNLDEAIASIIGIATASSLKYISGEKVNGVKTDEYRNPFVKDVIEVGNAKDDYLQYSNFFDMSAVDPEDLGKPLFVHLDMSMTGDKTGIAGVWITGREPNSKRPIGADGTSAAALEQTSFDDSGLTDDLHYKLAFSVSVKAPKGAQVSFAKNLNFLRWLRERGFDVKNVSTDTFQSAQLQQSALADGFKANIISVDRLTKDANGKAVCLPYHYLKAMIYERHVTMYQKCDLLTDELIGLERKSDGHIDHTKAGINSKDQADSFCLAGGTEIFMLSGEKKTIAELYDDYVKNGSQPWVLGYNTESHKPEPVQIQSVLDNGYKINLVKITLDTGESFICTDDHMLLTITGDYIEAGKAEGLSLMPFTYEARTMFKDRQYPYIYYSDSTGKQTGIYLHKLVAEACYPDEKLKKQSSCQQKEWVVIHHKDCNPFNNSPENLVYLTNTEHSKAHCDMNTNEAKRQQLKNATRFWAPPTYAELLSLGFNLKNRKAVKVEYLSQGQEVYDIKLDKIHNFAITAGVYVHNCGALWAASQFSDEYSYQYGDSLAATLDVSMEETDEGKRMQLISEFEEELTKIGDDYDRVQEIRSKKAQEELQYYKDIADGIIVI